MTMVSEQKRSLQKKSLYKPLRNNKGQTSIFVALIFQVLFILFAMAINVGMVVHDKINLQNSVDLAAFYAAQRQAEWLNAIAHTNYQIRQAFKLFAWRYKVLGTQGMDGEETFNGSGVYSPKHPSFTSNMSETVWDYAKSAVGCVAQSHNWTAVSEPDNLCRTEFAPIPALPVINVIAGFNPINMAIAQLTAQIQQNLNVNCNVAGAFSYYWSAAAAQSYRSDQYNRLKTIENYANNLAQGNPFDIYGQRISQGAKKTFQKNLTQGNLGGIQSFKMFNSLNGLVMQEWLPKILIQPSVWYMDMDTSGGCAAVRTDITVEPSSPIAMNYLLTTLNSEPLVSWMNTMNSFITGNDYNYTLGVEKNPWVMAYMGVEAKTVSRPVFFPFGNGVELTARAFAKPFGGRIGPWYYNTWPSSANMSSGERIDKVVPARLNPSGGFLDGADTDRLPDHAKYPGDELGLTSYMAQNALEKIGYKKWHLHFYSDTWKDISMGVPTTGDRLAWDRYANAAPLVRNYEIAAIAPDLFDITYYSIEPNYYDNYLKHIQAAKNKIFSDPNIMLRGDLGYRPGTDLESFSVQDQIKVAETSDNRIPGKPRKSQPFYFVRDQSDLLTDWMSGPNYGTRDNNWKIDKDYFGECQIPDKSLTSNGPDTTTNPGSCLARGGRTGYSVKIISKDALLSNDWEIGGGNEKGAIKNPPTDEGWVEF